MACVTLLTAGDASKHMGGDPTPAGIKKAAKAGRIRVALRTAGGIFLFSPHDIDTYKAERDAKRQQQTSEGARS